GREQLIEDTRQLASILESAHPDPYIGGGKIAFHRRLQKVLASIPAEGMSVSEFYSLLRPFVAAVQDAHTNILVPGPSADSGLGLPLGFEAVENQVYVARVYSEEHRPLVGAILAAVEGIPFLSWPHGRKSSTGSRTSMEISII
ncbi:MAG: hypothetical protein OEW18_06065, partial [Candidatus Aminicenantes bacterium]|nr:hypothetical protein [Candidatus Aminicenantes bacterium]